MRSCWTRFRSVAAQESRPWHEKASSSRSPSETTWKPTVQRPDARAVKVDSVFTSENRQRLSIKTINAPPIRAQDSFTGNAEVTAKANGVVPVTAQLMTGIGRPIGRPFDIEVQVTQNGTTGWAIVIAAGIVLVGTTSLRIRQVAKERAKAAAGAAAAGGWHRLRMAPALSFGASRETRCLTPPHRR